MLADRLRTRSWQRGERLSLAVSTLISALVHACALVLLVLLVSGVPLSSETGWLTAQLADPHEALDLSPVVELEQQASLEAASLAAGIGTRAFGASALESTLQLGDQSLVLADLGAADLAGTDIGWDVGDERLYREPRAYHRSPQGFFGIQAKGERFVYVVDCSGSMRGNRFRSARDELERVINELSDKHSFYIIFFNQQTYPMPEPDLLPATPENRDRILRWTYDARPMGFTHPLDALRMALGLEPDAIYFLTDGEFSPAVVQMIQQPGTGDKIPIHTIAFKSEAGGMQLRQIAAQSGGQYRFER